MGYITSGTTEYIDLHITERGRKFLLQGSLADQIVKFALGDGDKDYRNSQNLKAGFVPDVTGSHLNCIFGVNDGYDIESKITYIVGASDFDSQNAQMMFGYKYQGDYTWANKATVNIYLHDYLAMFKVLALYNAGHHEFGGINMSDFTSYFNGIFDTAGNPWSLDMKEFFETLEEQGKDTNLNIVHKIFKKDGGALVPTQTKLTLIGNNSELLFKRFFGGIYMNGSSGAVIGDGPQLGSSNNAIKFPSPFTMTNSVYQTQNGTFAGAGPLGIDVSAAIDFGYTFASVIAPNVTYYPQYGFNSDVGGFYNIYQSQTAGSPVQNQFNSSNAINLDTIIPTARYIFKNNPETNGYYILQTNQINNPGATSTLFKSMSGNLDGMSATESTSAWETFGMFMAGTAEYQKQTGNSNFDWNFNKIENPVDANLEPKMGITTLLYNIESFLTALESDPNIFNYVSVSGTGLNKVYKVPFVFQASDASNNSTKSATLNLNFILSLPALYENFTRDTSPILYRALDTTQTEARFYGGAYINMSEYTTDPTLFETTGVVGYKTFIEFKSV